MDYAGEPEESLTRKVPWLHKFYHHNCWVFTAPRKSEHQLTAESLECCRTQGTSRLPGREAPVLTATAEPGMPLWRCGKCI